ncbi:MAG: hypothetical protein J6X78_11825 [Treponema sp.]|nr:hypothetical protein [Treponema sp.]
MVTILIVLSLLFCVPAQAAFAQNTKPLYQLPGKITASAESQTETDVFLVGSDSGLFKVTSSNNVIPLWTEGRVDQISRVNISGQEGWIIRTQKGIFFTEDLKTFSERDNGLPFLTIKKFDGVTPSLTLQIQELKDFCINPLNNNEMVTATKDNVYYSSDAGQNWTSLGSMSKNSPGIKAVAVATIQGETVVFMAHSIFGLSYILPQKPKANWTDIEDGFVKMQSLSSPDEIADILPVVRTNLDGSQYTEIYISQTYLPCLYRLDWETKSGVLIYRGTEPVDSFDGLTIIDDVLVYTHLEGIGSLDINTLTSPGTPVMFNDWNKAFAAVPGMINSAWVPQTRSGFGKAILLNELWLLYPGTVNSPYAEKANGKKAIYASAYQCRNQEGIDKFKKVVKDRNMNALVIDMKDDYGFLRYQTKDPLVLEKGTVSTYAVDLEHFIDEFKKENIYLIARIVTFKDRSLTKYGGGKYAVWDSKLNKPWTGIKGYEDIVDEEGNVTGSETQYYDEQWVDPYSEEVWEYNIAVAKELIARGFDEIQFDYIRFPTDGLNLYNAKYRWQDKGMDKESALISFLSYARENINAPIGIDIYGANGWYRSGTRTGQDSELLSEYVDVIGPMFYPSHFEQTFLNYAPYADRTYRIYYYGSFRNTIMCRNRSIIRPWVQSFYLGVSYDKQYYDEDYIRKEFFGVRDSINRGYMCWNNSGEYGVTPPDVTDTENFTGTAPESSWEFKKPAIGTTMKPLSSGEEIDLSILDSILNLYADDDDNYYSPLLQSSNVKRYHN